MSSRILGGIIGFIVPLILLLVILFCAEYFIEIALGSMAFLANEAMGTSLDTSPNFPGPTDIVRDAIGFFPDIWDLGTLLFYGTIGQGTFLLYVFIALIAGVTGVKALKSLKTTMLGISELAILRSGMRVFTGSYNGGNGGNGSGEHPAQQYDFKGNPCGGSLQPDCPD